MTEDQFEFDWDRHNVAHIRRHGVSPEEFEEAWRNDRIFIRIDEVDGEDRWYEVGATNSLRVLVLVFTYREGRIRAVTVRDADRKVRKEYFERFSQSYG